MAKMGEQVQLGGSSARIIFTTLVLIIETLSVETQERSNTQFKWGKNLQHQSFKMAMTLSLLGKFKSDVYHIADAKRVPKIYEARSEYFYSFFWFKKPSVLTAR